MTKMNTKTRCYIFIPSRDFFKKVKNLFGAHFCIKPELRAADSICLAAPIFRLLLSALYLLFKHQMTLVQISFTLPKFKKKTNKQKEKKKSQIMPLMQ